jgi:hypothetical protein
MRQEDSRRPVWEFADRVQITRSVLEALWKALVVPAPSPTVAPCSLSAHPNAFAIVIGLRRCEQSSVDAAFDQWSPDDAGHLVVVPAEIKNKWTQAPVKLDKRLVDNVLDASRARSRC